MKKNQAKSGIIDLGISVEEDHVQQAMIAEESLLREFKDSSFHEKSSNSFINYYREYPENGLEIFIEQEIERLNKKTSIIKEAISVEYLADYKGYNQAKGYIKYLEKCDTEEELNQSIKYSAIYDFAKRKETPKERTVGFLMQHPEKSLPEDSLHKANIMSLLIGKSNEIEYCFPINYDEQLEIIANIGSREEKIKYLKDIIGRLDYNISKYEIIDQEDYSDYRKISHLYKLKLDHYTSEIELSLNTKKNEDACVSHDCDSENDNKGLTDLEIEYIVGEIIPKYINVEYSEDLTCFLRTGKSPNIIPIINKKGNITAVYSIFEKVEKKIYHNEAPKRANGRKIFESIAYFSYNGKPVIKTSVNTAINK